MIKKLLIGATAVLLTTACTYPTKTTVQGTQGSTVTFVGFPTGAELFVDQRSLGSVDRFSNGREALALPAGTHRVEIHNNGFSVHQEIIFLDGNNSAVVRAGS